jgi:DNA-binding NarL/FixJ family response regulator
MPPTHTDEGLVAARALRADHPEIGVLVLSQYVEPSYAMRLIQDHPERVGYLLKERVFDIAIVVVTERTVEAHVTQILLKLGLAESPDQHRRVLAVLTFLRA